MKRIKKANLIKLEEALDHVNESIKWLESIALIEEEIDTRVACKIANNYLNKALNIAVNAVQERYPELTFAVNRLKEIRNKVLIISTQLK